MSRVVVIGSSGQVGSALCRLLGPVAVPVTRSTLDLAERTTIRPALERLAPDIVINAAAYTAVDAAESDPETARSVNELAVGELASVCSSLAARFVTYSTDYVFDGSKGAPYVESDPTRPINVYGASKRDGEIRALDALSSTLVIRTSWVMSATHRNFASVILDKLASGSIRVVDDQYGRPTFADDLAAGTLEAVDLGAEGIVHMTNEGDASWYDIARSLAANAGWDPDRVEACPTSEYPTPAARPQNSRLGSERFDALGLTPLRPWTEALAEAVSMMIAGDPRRSAPR